MAKIHLHSLDTLRQVIEVDHCIGKAYWLPRSPQMFLGNDKRICKTWNTRYSGKEIGSLRDDGYINCTITIEGKKVVILAHNLFYAIYHNDQNSLVEEVDHINGIKDDNRIVNLRLATNSQQNFNTGIRKDNKSGVKGVYWRNEYKKWAAQIKANKKTIFLGYYENKEEAIKARKDAEIKYHGEYRRK